VKTEVPADPHLWHKHEDAIAGARSNALQLVDAADLAEARLQFAEVSTSLETLLMATGVPPSFDRQVQVLHCPMYPEGGGGTIWLQSAGRVRNPYMGQRMLECFDQRTALPVTGGGRDAAPVEPSQPEAPDESGATPQAAGDGDDYPIDFCLVSGAPLGSMGPPVTVEYQGRTLKFCCEGCIAAFQAEPEMYHKQLDEAAKNLDETPGGVDP